MSERNEAQARIYEAIIAAGDFGDGMLDQGSEPPEAARVLVRVGDVRAVMRDANVGSDTLATLRAEVDRLTRERDEARAVIAEAMRQRQAGDTEADRQRQRAERAEAALEPFARAADDWHEMGDTRPICAGLTVADLRRARAARQPEGGGT